MLGVVGRGGHRSVDAGASGFRPKPFDPDVLMRGRIRLLPAGRLLRSEES